MNKIIIGLIATVVLLGVALVTLNNQLKPNVAGQSSMDGAAAPAARLPELPAIAGQTAQTKLMPLPTPPEGEAETLKDISVEANIDKKLPPLEDYVLHMPVSRPNSQTAQAQPAPSAAGSALLADSTQSRPLPPAAAADMQAAGQAVIQPVTRPAPAVTAAAAEKPAAKPAEDRPAVEKPAVKPAEDKPAVEKSAVKPAEDKPAAEKPAAKPAEDKPAVEKPAAKPAEDKPAAEKPAAKPAEDKPAAEKPAAKPAENKPAARKPAAKPAEDKPAAEKPAAKPAPEKPAPKARPAEQDKSRITVFARETGATVRIALGRTVTGYKPMLLDNPDRLVVDITGEYPDLRAPGVPSNPLVTNVRLGKYDNRTRVVIDLKKAPGKHRIILSEDRQRIDVRVDR